MQWYKDPLFGIILLFILIAIIGAIDFIRNRLRERKHLQSLENLEKSYNFLGIKNGVEEFLKLNNNALPTLEFIAQMYIQSGNIQEAIKIYTSILDKLTDSQEKVRILYALGVAHFQSGFLQRAKNIFLEIIKNYPRNPEILSYLLRTYEKLNEYHNAIDVIDCLKEIYEQSANIDDTKYIESLEHNRVYLQTMYLLADDEISFEKKIYKLEDLKAKFPKLEKLILVFYKHYNLALFWQKAQEAKNIENLLDIFWRCSRDEVPLDSIVNPKILEIYKARGFIQTQNMCAKFELENIRLLRKYTDFRVDLYFEYRCVECKTIFPLESHRCPTCNALLSFEVLCKVREQKDEISYPLL